MLTVFWWDHRGRLALKDVFIETRNQTISTLHLEPVSVTIGSTTIILLLLI